MRNYDANLECYHQGILIKVYKHVQYSSYKNANLDLAGIACVAIIVFGAGGAKCLFCFAYFQLIKFTFYYAASIKDEVGNV
ncbi:hypothetical protein [Cytobacillus sp. BC1816]|uniref:hypothetical protein n=1 Tax=Cytobacillus sp. BC1816 TaxID=3440154 RepID=UPI003F512617